MSTTQQRQHAEQVWAALEAFVETCIDIDKEVRGGVPVLKGTRIPVALLLAEVRDSDFLNRFARRFEIDAKLLQTFFDQVMQLWQQKGGDT